MEPKAVIARSAAEIETQWATMLQELDKGGMLAYLVKCNELYSTTLTRRHNNSNIIVFRSSVMGLDMEKMLMDQFL